MISVIPPGDPAHTVVAGKAQGFLGLAINYDRYEGWPCMTTAWEPTAAELEAINKGAKVIIRILGVPPISPMMVEPGAVPTAD